MMRFVVQWYVSERQGRSTVPVAFWYLSLVGGLMLGLYAFLKQDPVFFLGQLLGVMIYIRNLVLIHRERRLLRAAAGGGAVSESER
ncbi:MAG: lipid-A-disaccharide synthase N-terminal domain-containing protein [Phycisphaerae bacterium]|nr:lipid-A-disaccharide synthase N-terminal domain-containing protein [Phycisphaerae bacterium]